MEGTWRLVAGRWRIVLAAVLVLTAAAALAFALTRPAASAPKHADAVIPVARRTAAERLSGGRVLVPPPLSLRRYRGRVLFVNFWASWCIPCREEAPQLSRFADGLDRHEAALVGVDINDHRMDALRFIHRYHLSYPNTADRGSRIMDRYEIVGIPTTFVLDGNARIAARLLGPQTVTSLTAMLHRLRPEGSG